MRIPRLRLGVILAVVSSCMLAACAETQMASVAVKQAVNPYPAAAPQGNYKVGEPYQIDGIWYYPKEDYNYDETGIASWYGPNFHGKSTANGEVFDQNDVSAAHRTLPLPSIVRVTNLDNGRELVVRVNDRGPYVRGRIIDMSRRAAQLLGFETNGTAKVRVQVMADESRALKAEMLAGNNNAGAPPAVAPVPQTVIAAETLPPPGSAQKSTPLPSPPPPPVVMAAIPTSKDLADQPVEHVPVHPTQMYIQAGAFSILNNARQVSAKLAKLGPVETTKLQTKAGTFYRVRVGPLASLDAADAMLEKVIGVGYPGARLIVD